MKLFNGRIISIVLILLLFLSAITIVNGTEVSPNTNSIDIDELTIQALDPAPANYRHRPLVEFFTGLSCPSCMNGPHQDMDKVWEENS